MTLTGDFVLMPKSNKNICILGGNDDLANSLYYYCKKKFNKSIYINFSSKKFIKKRDKNIFNLKLY